MKKVLSSSVILYTAIIFSFFPVITSAQASANGTSPPIGSLPSDGQLPGQTFTTNAQAQTFTSNTTTLSPGGTSGDLTSTIMNGSRCSAGTILSNLITSSIGSSIGGLGNKALSNATDGLLYVPTVARGYPANQQLLETYRTVGVTDPTGNTLVSASFNAIAWCIVNTMIQYITQATIQWAKTGFNGNPAFIDNPDQFFKGIADQTAGNFIQDLVSGQTGINICAPFRNLIGISLAQNYSSSYAQRSSCSLTNIGHTFSQGNYMSDWLSMSQNGSNYPSGAYIEASNEMSRQMTFQNSSARTSADWNRGYLSFQTCSTPGVQSSCKITTPGSLIQSNLESTLNIPKNRLVIAQSFDQLVSTLVNSLISVALNKVLSSTNGTNGQ